MRREVDIEKLRTELVGVVRRALTPVALKYRYSEVPLEDNIKWRPLVLLLGNYSSGKSTLINELLGADVQATGQAPTDDCFTVITSADASSDAAGVGAALPSTGGRAVADERDGSVLLNDPQFPFSALRRHGQRFAQHFRLKTVHAPLLRSMALIDTPGMLDAVTERGRAYDYQQVVGDLAQIADLVLVMFDPHKAGTIREVHASLRETLPARTFADRVVFVLNRADECDNLSDLLRVYGTLCWNLSQMLGRKDMPPIMLSYAPGRGPVPEYLKFLTNQRSEVKHQIEQAPRYRLDHLASFAETHGERLAHLLEALLFYAQGRQRQALRTMGSGVGLALVAGLLLGVWLYASGTVVVVEVAAGLALAVAVLAAAVWWGSVLPLVLANYHRSVRRDLDALTPLTSAQRQGSWELVKPLVAAHLDQTGGRLRRREIRQELASVKQAVSDETRSLRQQIGALVTER